MVLLLIIMVILCSHIVDIMKISAASVNWHIRRLISFKIIYETKDGKYKRYQLTGGNTDYSKYIVSLLKNYYPSIWDNWSNRLAEMFLSLSTRQDDNNKNKYKYNEYYRN